MFYSRFLSFFIAITLAHSTILYDRYGIHFAKAMEIILKMAILYCYRLDPRLRRRGRMRIEVGICLNARASQSIIKCMVHADGKRIQHRENKKKSNSHTEKETNLIFFSAALPLLFSVSFALPQFK